MRLLGPGTPPRHWDSANRGTYDRSRNAEKRAARAENAKAKHQPGGWKKGVRIWQETERMLRRGVESQREARPLTVERLQEAKRVLKA